MIKIFSYGWHTAHQHSLCSVPGTHFSYISNRVKPSWNESCRPWPNNLDIVDHYEPGKYDLAILHVDQQCLFGGLKGVPYRECNKMINDIPKIVINHGTPHFQNHPPEMIARMMKDSIGDNLMIVNSHEARKEWGFGEVIVHGLDPKEWKVSENDKTTDRITTVLSPGNSSGDHSQDGWAEYYDRYLFDAVRGNVDVVWVGKDKKFENFEDYRKFLAESLIYFNPTRFSPMPRSRTEAMLLGCCVVTTPYHDADRFITHGVNGFLFKTEKEAVKILKHLKKNTGLAVKVGMAGRETALEIFSKKRFDQEWLEKIKKVKRGEILPNNVTNLKSTLLDLYSLMGREEKKDEIGRLLDVILKDHIKDLYDRYNT